MAVRQYVGARYVPKFFENPNGSAEWVKETTYEPLTIVTYLGNSYTSKKPVPLNVDITNTEYWVLTGNYNEQIEEYRKEVENVNNRITDLTTKRYIFVGDSYGVLTNSWIDLVIRNLNLTLNENAFKVSANSRGFIGDTSQPGDMTWKTLLLNASIPNPETITDIIVCGGANDALSFTNTSVLTNAIEEFCYSALNKYQNAKISIGMIAKSTNQTIINNLMSIVHCYKDLNYQWCYINNSEFLWGFDSDFLDDRHPNTTASKYIACGITNYILNGTTQGGTSNGLYSGNITKDGILTSANYFAGGFESGYDNALTFGNINIVARFNSPVNIECSDDLQLIANFSNSYFRGGEKNSISITVRMYDSTDNVYYNVDGCMSLTGKKVYIRIPYKGATGTTNKTIKCTEFNIIPTSFCLLTTAN